MNRSPSRPAPGDENGQRVTLPPPEWTGPVKPERRVSAAPPPLQRREGADQAAEGTMRARLEAARATGDLIVERDAALELARWLASRDRGLDEAAALARRALELSDESELRLELSTWLENLGDAAAAADALRPVAAVGDVDPAEAARVLVRVGVLFARAGDARAAGDAFRKAAGLNPVDATASELRGTLAAWAPHVVTRAEAAEAFVEAASRRATAGAVDAQFEDLLRAQDIDASSSVAVAALAAAQVERGRPLAADEAWRAHAAAIQADEPKRAAAVHARRRLQARAASDAARAFGAALDEGLDGQFTGEGADILDDLLLRVGLLEPLAARLELRAERAPAAERAATYEELARLLAGPLASPERAAVARVGVLQAGPAREDAVIALRAHASSTRDATHLVEGLIRAIGAPRSPSEPAVRQARAQCARALASLAEEQLGDAALATWAFGALAILDPRDGAAAPGIARHSGRYEALREQVAIARRNLEIGKGEARLEPLRVLGTLLRSMPDEAELHASILAELITRAPDERKWRPEALRIAWRRHDYPEVARLSREHVAHARGPADRVDARVALAAALRALGDAEAANEATRALLIEAAGHRGAASAAWVNAAAIRDSRTRGAAIEQLAGACSGPVRGVMLAVAAESLASAGDRTSARAAAEQACQADPSSARAVATLAEAVLGARDRTAASVLERAVSMVGARGGWCAALAEALEGQGELAPAVGWTQRLVALRPGDRAGIELLVRRIVRARDGARLADALSWVLSQPQPATPLADLVARALRDQVLLDTDRAVVLARRAVDAFGARPPSLREAMLEVADAARDDGFAALVLERALAVDFSADRGDLVVALARRRAALRDADGEARALARAMREGARTPELETRLRALRDVRLSGDGEIARLEAWAELLAARPDRMAAAQAWRELGAALWDVAGDRVGAVRAWLRASRLAPARGYVTLGVDLARFAGSRYALDCLTELVDKETDRARSGALAAEAARVALALEEPARALELASLALERNPTLAAAVEIAERGAVAVSREAEMSRIYDHLGSKALGRFGCRAAHYRGARFFEQRGDPGLALKHAAQAFCAVPSEGATFLLLRRTAERADDRGQAVRTVVQVADSAKHPATRAGWLLRAAALASADEEGVRQRVDVLLRAVLLAPDLGTLAMLADASRELSRMAPEEREPLQIRLARASRTVTAKIEGPDGARVAIAFAELGLDLFDDAEWAMRALERAFHADADMDEFARLEKHAGRLASAEEAGAHLARMVAVTDQPFANVGIAALRLLAAIAGTLGDRGSQTKLVVLAACREPDDDTLVREADTLARGDEAALDRLRKKVPDGRRAEAFRALARDKRAEGAHEEAIRALERASEVLQGDERAAVEREISAAYEAAGRAEEVEGRAMREANLTHLPPVLRAQRWTEVAQYREAKGDMVGAADALLAAANLDGAPIERWSALERVAELARLDDVRVSAIREISVRVDVDARAAVLKRLARAYESRFDTNAAEATWQSILKMTPDDEEADYALEAVVTARGDYSDLAQHLARRAERLAIQSGTREALRAVRLRRAAILEQRLNRVDDACEELLQVLKESPDNVSAMSYLADLYERMGEAGRAAPLWARVAALSRDPQTQSEIELRASRAALSAGDHGGALSLVKMVLAREPGRRDALDQRVDIARATHDDGELGDALEELALASSEGPVARSDALIEASNAAVRVGDLSAALARAQRAARLAPDRPEAQLLARNLEYRVRGSGPPDEARRTVEELSRLPGNLRREDSAMQAFLMAEALDAVQGHGAGMRVLTDRVAVIGEHPLLAVGIAERLVAQFNFESALPHFQQALLGDLSAVRDRGKVALAAADVAIRTEEPESAFRLLEEAALEPSARASAMLRMAHLATTRGDRARARRVLEELAESSDSEDRARALAQLGRMLMASTVAAERAEADAIFDLAMEAAPRGSVLAAQLAVEREARRPQPLPGSVEEPPPLSYRDGAPPRRSSPRPTPHPALPPPSLDAEELVARAAEQDEAAGEAPAAAPGPTAPNLLAMERAISEAATPEEKSQARVALARAHMEQGAFGAAELCLQEGLAEGGLEEGNLLARLLEPHHDRAHELVRVRRRQVELVPGDLGLLEDLRVAALADHNPIYARAVEHVARSFDPGAGPLPPPPLGVQDEQPGLLPLLTRLATDRVALAFGLLWESAHAVFVRDPKSYGITGTERVTPGNTSPLARLYEVTIRLLDTPRVPLFVRRSTTPLAGGGALLWPAAAVISGTPVDDTPELRLVLGQAIAAAFPQNALLLGLPAEEVRVVWNALLGAFGPPELGRSLDSRSATLAERFWQTISAAIQRRLTDLLAPARPEELEGGVERARQCGRRVGLFLTGDFGVVARALVGEGAVDRTTLAGPSLRALCGELPQLTDLLRLAVTPEYADARWHPVPPGSQRGNMSSNRMRVL